MVFLSKLADGVAVGNWTQTRKGNSSIPSHCKFRECFEIPVFKIGITYKFRFILSEKKQRFFGAKGEIATNLKLINVDTWKLELTKETVGNIALQVLGKISHASKIKSIKVTKSLNSKSNCWRRNFGF